MQTYIKHLPDDARQIEGALTWVDRKGNLYGMETRYIPSKDKKNRYPHKHYGEFFKYSLTINNRNGYVYGSIKKIEDETNHKYTQVTKRIHILVAKTFIENPNNYPVVGHRNNIKTDNRVENLYWTTYKENTQKAVDDGLLVNDKGIDDSQSKPVIMFNTMTNEEINKFGGIKEASRITGIPASTIARQAKYKKPVRKPFYFRYTDDESIQPSCVVIEYDYQTHEEINRYWNIAEAARQTGVSPKTIQCQCKLGRQPVNPNRSSYFLYGI